MDELKGCTYTKIYHTLYQLCTKSTKMYQHYNTSLVLLPFKRMQHLLDSQMKYDNEEITST